MITVHGFSPSGNCHKVRLLLEQLGRRLDRDYAWVETDSAHGATRTPEYLAKNPNGKVPMLELDDGRILVEAGRVTAFDAAGALSEIESMVASLRRRNADLFAVAEAIAREAP